MQSRMRDLVNMAKSAGLEVLRHYQKANYFFVDACAPNGVEGSFFVLAKLSAGRDDLDCLTRMRRFARINPRPSEVPPPPPPVPEAPATDSMPPPAPAHATKPTPKRRILKVTKQAATTPPATASLTAEAGAAQELTPIEFYRLCEWLKSSIALANVPTLVALSLEAARHIGQSVSERAMREAMEATGTTEPDHWSLPPEPHIVVARELAAFMKQLGAEPSPTFARLMETMA